MRSSSALLVALLLLVGCTQEAPRQTAGLPTPTKSVAEQPISVTGEVVGDFVIGEPLRYANLTVFPISSRIPKTADRFLTLDEGLATGQVEIREVGGTIESDEELSLPNGATLTEPESTGSPSVHVNIQPDVVNPLENECSDVDDPFGAASPVEVPDAEDPFANQPSNDESAEKNYGSDATPDVEEMNELITAQVEEMEAEEGDVNRLMFVNRSDRPLYLMPGELIIGGKQDRTIARETIVPPGGKRVEVEVFCVEQGRWSSRTVEALRESLLAANGGEVNESGLAVSVSRDFNTADPDSEEGRRARLRSVDLKARDKFVASLGSVSSVTRRAVQEENDQSAVWDKVQQEIQRAGVSTETDAFTANYVDEGILALLAPYMQHLGKPVAEKPQVVGVLVAVGHEIRTVDVFESTPMFQKMWPKLLKSFAFDALDAAEILAEEPDGQTAAEDRSPRSDPPTLADARRCLEIAALSHVQEIKTADGLTMTRRQTEEMVSFSVHDQESSAAVGGMGGGGGGFGGAVHGGGFF